MKSYFFAAGVAAALCLAPSLAHGQAKIRLINLDGPGVGLNDPTPMAPTAGNPGRTLGQQRMITFQYAMDLWGALLRSGPEIRAEASFAPLGCQKGYTLLGQANATLFVTADNMFTGGSPDFYYQVALADAIAGRDFNPENSHIAAEFSSSIDDVDCQQFGANGWFYGLHGNSKDNPGYRSNFLNVVMHELAHGLGFYDLNSAIVHLRGPYGAMAWSNDSSMFYNDFTSREARLIDALTSPGRSVWKGQKTTAAVALLAENKNLLKITSPQQMLLDYAPAPFGSQERSALSGEVVLVDDEALPDGSFLHTGCDGRDGQPAIRNRDDLKGKVVLIDAGGCDRGWKIFHAQNLGATGVILANSSADAPLLMGNAGAWAPQIRIPAIAVTQEVGAILRSEGPVIAAGFVQDKSQFYGLDALGRVKLFTPKVHMRGSTLSHVDPEMSPDFIMEAAEGRGMQAGVMIDAALEMMEEMGWPTNRNGTAKLGNCETGIPVYKDGFIPGANLIAHNNMCKTAFSGSRAQQLRCMNDQINWLQDQTLLSSLEVAKARQCVAKL